MRCQIYFADHISIFDQVERGHILTLQQAAEPFSTSPERSDDTEAEGVPLYVYVEDLPEVITPLLQSAVKRKQVTSAVVAVATGGTVQEAIFSLRSFLPGAESGHFSLQEVAAIMKYHFQGVPMSEEEVDGDAGTTLKSRLKSVSEENLRPVVSNIDSFQGESAGAEEDGSDDVSWRYRGKSVLKHPERYTSAPSASLPRNGNGSGSSRYPTSLPASASRPAEYFLPTHGNIHDRKIRLDGKNSEPYRVSEAEVMREFAKLDLSGEGRLTFLTVKSALELMRASPSSASSDADDVVIRAWLRDHDRGAKGYVDWSDFSRIFAQVLSDVSPEFSAMDVGERYKGVRGGAARPGIDQFALSKHSDDRVNRLKA